MSERMRSKIRSYAVIGRNLADGTSLASTAESALSEVSANLTRIRELALQSLNGTTSAAETQVLQGEYTTIISEIQRVVDSTEFNDQSLLDTTGSISIQAGLDASETIDVDTTDLSFVATALGALDLTGPLAGFVTTVTDIAADVVTGARAEFGAMQNRLAGAQSSTMTARDNLAAAQSRIRDVAVAEESANLIRLQIMQQAGVYVLAHANLEPRLALRLLNS